MQIFFNELIPSLTDFYNQLKISILKGSLRRASRRGVAKNTPRRFGEAKVSKGERPKI